MLTLVKRPAETVVNKKELELASPQQKKVFEEVMKGSGNMAIQATAGAGKTFTLVGAAKLLPKFKKVLFCSFSNAIVNELKERLPQSVKVSTLHSIGNRFLQAKFKGVSLNQNKYFSAALDYFEEKNKESYKKAFIIQDLCNYARLTLTPFKLKDLQELCNLYMIDATEEMIEIAIECLKKHTKLKRMFAIDFADMIYFPAVYSELVTEQYDVVFVDEVQDTNNAQVELLNNILKANGRVIICGDEKQAIYGFQGSNVDSFQKVSERFTCKRFELTVTRRCSKAVVELAKSVYPEVIESHESAKEGFVNSAGDLTGAVEGDMVICRNTKPLVAAFFLFLGQGKKSYIVGKDLENGLIKLAESVQGYSIDSTKQNIYDKLDAFEAELKNEGVKNPSSNPKYIALLEKSEILLFLLERINTVGELVTKIQDIFCEDRKAIKLLTSHRSKGLENERVYFIEKYNNKTLLPSEFAVLDWQRTQENNLLFVTYTRAKDEFIFCELNDK